MTPSYSAGGKGHQIISESGILRPKTMLFATLFRRWNPPPQDVMKALHLASFWKGVGSHVQGTPHKAPFRYRVLHIYIGVIFGCKDP